MNFERGKSPKEALSIGGYSLYTLRVGSVLQITKRFGLSREEGKIRDYHECAIQCPYQYFMLVTRIEACSDPSRRTIHFILQNNFDKIESDLEILEKGTAFPGWRTTGKIGNCSKRMFNYRLKVIKPGL